MVLRLTNRLVRTHSCSRKSMVFPPHPPVKATAPPPTHPPEEMPIHTARPRTSVSSASPPLETLSSSHVDIWSSAEIVLLEWSNSVPAVKSPDERKPRQQKVMPPLPSLGPQPLLVPLCPTPPLLGERLPEAGRDERERQKDGIVPFVDNLILRYSDLLFLPMASLSMRTSILNSHVLPPGRVLGRQIRDMHLLSPLPYQGVQRRCWKV